MNQAEQYPAAAVERFTRVAEEVHQASGAPGLTAAFVTSDGTVQSIALGIADTEAAAPMTPASRMPGGSTGKTIVAATALSLVHDGLLTLDGPLSNWLGGQGWFPRLPNAGDLTLRNLLSHSSGLPDHMGLPATLPHFIAMRRAHGPDWYCPPVEAVGMILDLAPIAPANRTFFYSDTNYILAGLALEAVAGHPLHELQIERVLARLGIDDVEPAIKRHFDRIVPGYTNAPEGSPLPRKTIGDDGGLVYSPRTEWAGGGMVSGAPGLARFIRAYAGGHAFDWPYLDEVRRLVRFSWVENQVGGYGIGLFATGPPSARPWAMEDTTLAISPR